jgi:hypothetical protein
MAPLAGLPYLAALATWLAMTLLIYVAVVLAAGRLMYPTLLKRDLFLAAAAYPPFWYTVGHGQLSVFSLGAFVLFGTTLKWNRKLLAGLALGSLSFKPSLLGPALLVLVLAGEGRVCIGVAVASAAQLGVGALHNGLYSIDVYTGILGQSRALVAGLAARPDQMHSLRAFWLLLAPAPWSALLYLTSATVVVLFAARVWRQEVRWDTRAALLPLVTVLASPHLYHYDLLILAPTLLWMAGRTSLRESLDARLLMAGYCLPLVGILALVIRVQLSVLVYCALLCRWFSPSVRCAHVHQ